MLAVSTIRARLSRVGMLEPTLAICRRHRVSFGAVWSGARERPLPYVRAIIYGTLRRSLLWSYPRIARLLGAPDHTNILWCVNRYCPGYADIDEGLAAARRNRVENTVRELMARSRRAA